ncbi:hypothetical protein HaLaN_31604, partial [Haematococcus lacustris]
SCTAFGEQRRVCCRKLLRLLPTEKVLRNHTALSSPVPSNRRILGMFKLTSPTVDIRRHQLLLAPSTSGAFHRGCVHGCLTTAASSINQLDMRFVTYPAGLGIGAAM